MSLMEVVYRQPDGMIFRALAFYSYRGGPIGEWIVGDRPLAEIDGEIVYRGARMSDVEFARRLEDWREVT
jgi:hypothetical protein